MNKNKLKNIVEESSAFEIQQSLRGAGKDVRAKLINALLTVTDDNELIDSIVSSIESQNTTIKGQNAEVIEVIYRIIKKHIPKEHA